MFSLTYKWLFLNQADFDSFHLQHISNLHCRRPHCSSSRIQVTRNGHCSSYLQRGSNQFWSCSGVYLCFDKWPDILKAVCIPWLGRISFQLITCLGLWRVAYGPQFGSLLMCIVRKWAIRATYANHNEERHAGFLRLIIQPNCMHCSPTVFSLWTNKVAGPLHGKQKQQFHASEVCRENCH